MKLRRIYRFEAAHRLVSPHLDDAENRALYGKCYREGGHGHNYEIELIFEGECNPDSGMLMPRAAMDAVVEEFLLSRVDHRDLNRVVDLITTGEMLAIVFAGWLSRPFREYGIELRQVVVHETARNRMETLHPLAFTEAPA